MMLPRSGRTPYTVVLWSLLISNRFHFAVGIVVQCSVQGAVAKVLSVPYANFHPATPALFLTWAVQTKLNKVTFECSTIAKILSGVRWRFLYLAESFASISLEFTWRLS